MENPRIILGLGTGRCGSRNLHQLFLKQRLLKHNNSIQNKLKYCMHEYKWFPKFQTQTELNKLFYTRKYIERVIYNVDEYSWPISERNYFNFNTLQLPHILESYNSNQLNSDITSDMLIPYYDLKFHIHINYLLLDYVDSFVKSYSNVYVVVLKRPKGEFIDSILNKYYIDTGAINLFEKSFFVGYLIQEYPDILEKKHCDIFEIAKQFWGNYWDNYYNKINYLKNMYPNKIRCYNYINVLNNESIQKDMLEFCGFDNPVIHTKWKIKIKTKTK